MAEPFPGPWTFKYHPWLREMHDASTTYVVGQKSAQAGFTECLLNRVLYAMDIEKRDILYVLPNLKPDAVDFSAARFDKALELSEHINSLFDKNRNVGHKRAGTANMYIRGSHSKSGFKSIPISFMALDEYDEMNQERVALVEQRLAGQVQKQIWKVSTPTIPGFGINKVFRESTQEHFYFPCPCCGKNINLERHNLVVADKPGGLSWLECHLCHGRLPEGNAAEREAKAAMLSKGFWTSHVGLDLPDQDAGQAFDPDVRGFRVNQLYSCTVSSTEFARTVRLAEDDPHYKQELHNSMLGEPFVAHDAKVTAEQYNETVADHTTITQVPDATIVRTLGIDVGNFLHWVVVEWKVTMGPDVNTNSVAKVIALGKYRHFTELAPLMRRYNIHHAVIDMNPEKRKAKEFADQFRGYVNLCYYGNGQQGRSIALKANPNDLVADYQITVDRTGWLDTSIGRFMKRGAITVPKDAPDEFRAQICNLVKVYGKDKNGNPNAKYVCAEERINDHYGHALNYAEVALPLALGRGSPEAIRSFL